MEMRIRGSFTALSMLGVLMAVAGLAGQATADTLNPVVVFGVEDNEFDGVGDDFSSASLASAIFTRFREQRSFAEYDLSGLGGPAIESATITAVLDEGFSFGFGTTPADFAFDVYSGNGAADLSDFSIAGTTVGTVTLDEDFDTYNLVLDVTDALQALVDGGATHLGLRSLTTTANVGQVDIENPVLDVTAVPEPAALALLTLGLLAAGRRR